MNERLTALEEWALYLASNKPCWALEDSVVKIRFTDRRYFVIDEVDAGILESLRSIVPQLIEDRRG